MLAEAGRDCIARLRSLQGGFNARRVVRSLAVLHLGPLAPSRYTVGRFENPLKRASSSQEDCLSTLRLWQAVIPSLWHVT